MCINFQFWVFNKLQFISFAAFILFLSKAFSHIENFVINNIDWKQCVSGKALFFFNHKWLTLMNLFSICILMKPPKVSYSFPDLKGNRRNKAFDCEVYSGVKFCEVWGYPLLHLTLFWSRGRECSREGLSLCSSWRPSRPFPSVITD